MTSTIDKYQPNCRTTVQDTNQVGQVRSGNLISPLARGYIVAPSKEKKIYKIQLKVRVKLMNTIMQNQPTIDDESIPISNLLTRHSSGPKLFSIFRL